MTEQEFDRLIRKYLSGKITNNEKNILFKEYDLRQNNPPEWNPILMGGKDDVSKRIHTKIMERIETRESIKKQKSLYFKIAASLFLIINIGFYFYLSQEGKLTPLATQTEIIQPGGDKAFIVLEGGNRLSLNDLNDGDIIEQGEAKFIKDKDGFVSYYAPSEIARSKSQEVFNTIQTPKGGQYTVLLSDGTKVWLNAFSSLRFPAVFSSDKRTVELSGEAYFEVAKKKAPFLVKTNEQEIEVLGTHFNVQNYQDELFQQVTLVEGLVKVSPTILKNSQSVVLIPGQQAFLNDQLSVFEVDVNEALAWKNGYFQFVESDLETVMRQLSRWYNVEIVYKNGKKSPKLFSGKINRDISIQHVFEMLKYFEVDFKIEGRSIVVQT